MNNRITKRFSITTAILALFFSCDFKDTNLNPARPTETTLESLLPAGEALSAWATGGDLVRYSGILMRHFEGVNAQHLDHTKYLIRGADMDDPWFRLYSSSLNTCNQVVLLANEQNGPHYEGMAKVLMASLLITLTDAYGDVPYSDALEADQGNDMPTYDTQESLYTTTIPTLLDEAIALLGDEAGLAGNPGSEDLIYNGETDKWIAAANSLKVRLAIQSAKRDASAYDNALALLPSAIASNEDDFEMMFGNGPTEVGPQYQFAVSRSGNILMDSTFVDSLRNNSFRDTLRVNNDTRLDFFVAKNTADDAEGDLYVWGGSFSRAGGYYTTQNSPVVFMSYVELKFIEAESQLMKGGSDETAAKTALDAAITASFNKITGAGVPAAYQTELDNKWSGATTQADKLRVLIGEKYIACYSQGMIVWNDYRRTGYPEITPNPAGSNAFNPSVNGNVAIPRRLPYPQTELILNNANVPIKTGNLQTRMWWDQE